MSLHCTVMSEIPLMAINGNERFVWAVCLERIMGTY